MFPTDHPAHYLPPSNVLPKPARELICEADVILALDWVDLGGALRQAKTVGKVSGQDHRRSLDQSLHTGANMEYQALPPVDVSDGDERRRRGRRTRWTRWVGWPQGAVEGLAARRSQGKQGRQRRSHHHGGRSPQTLRVGIQRSGECQLLHARPRLADRYLAVPERACPISARTAAAASAPGPASRSARRSRCSTFRAAMPITMLGDGDFCMGATAIWSAAQHRIPLLGHRQQQPLLLQ